MSQEVALHHLLGRMVRDPDGRKIGRIEELCAEIQLHDAGNDYVVVEFHIGSFGALEALAGGRFARLLLRRLGSLAPYSVRRIPWNEMDLSDVEHPRTRTAALTRPSALAAP